MGIIKCGKEWQKPLDIIKKKKKKKKTSRLLGFIERNSYKYWVLLKKKTKNRLISSVEGNRHTH